MERRLFGKTGLRVSAIGFGGGPIGFVDTDRARVSHLLNVLLDADVNVIDTAAAYRGSEEIIGESIGHRRAEYVLISKCGRPDDDIQGKPWSADLITRTVDRALRRLRTDHLDVMLLHSCDLQTLEQGEALGALTLAREAGKVRWVGYSGDNDAAVWASQHPQIDVLQMSANVCDQANLERVLPHARTRDVAVIAKRPIANSAWKDAATQPGIYRDYAKTYAERLQQMGLSPADLGFVGDPASGWPEIALRFTLGHSGVHTAIIGTTNPDHARANLAFAEKGRLAPEVSERIRQAFRDAERASGTAWVGQT